MAILLLNFIILLLLLAGVAMAALGTTWVINTAIGLSISYVVVGVAVGVLALIVLLIYIAGAVRSIVVARRLEKQFSEIFNDDFFEDLK